MLPIRLGTVNANGPQDMIVLMLTEKGRVETTNYRTVKMPSNVEVPIYTKAEFGNFYKAMFDTQVKKDDMRAVYLEYAWDMGWCDPCAADPVPNDKLVALGATWIAEPRRRAAQTAAAARLSRGFRPRIRARRSNVFVTRLHVRYDAKHVSRGPDVPGDGRPLQLPGPLRPAPSVQGRGQVPGRRGVRRSLGHRASRRRRRRSPHLTGWDIAEIRARMSANGQAIK